MSDHPLGPFGDENVSPIREDAAHDESYFGIDEVSQQPHKPFLRPLVILLIAGAVIAFLSGVAAVNATPQSVMEYTASGINRAGVIAMLFACAGILASYRYEAFVNWVNGVQLVNRKEWFDLVVVVAGMCLGFWFLLILMSIGFPGSVAYAIGAFVLMVQAAVAANMIFVHRGMWRGFAVGVLAATLLFVSSGIGNYSYVFFMQVGFGGARSPGALPIWPIGLVHTAICLCGTVTGLYSYIATKVIEQDESMSD